MSIDAALPSVCIVTGEAVGLATGGIGTAMTGLAETLARAGHRVTLLYTKGFWLTRRDQERARARFESQGIEFEPLRLAAIRGVRGPFGRLDYPIPVAVYDWLRAREVAGNGFDIIHGNDTDADCVLALAAKRAGLAFQATLFCTAVHSPRAWVQEMNGQQIMMSVSVVMEETERAVIRDADLVWSPSRYMFDWVAGHGFPQPRAAIVQPYVLPQSSLPSRLIPTSSTSLRTLVFFGRQERRKGLFIFLEAIRMLAADISAGGIEVVFLGPATLIDGRPSGDIIGEVMRGTGLRWRIEAGKSQPDALAFLATEGRLAIMASPEDNSPCTVYEVLESGIPFLASRGGGIPELLDDPNFCFEPTAQALAVAIRQATNKVPEAPAARRPQADIAADWVAAHGPHGWRSVHLRRGAVPARLGTLFVAGTDNQVATLDALPLPAGESWAEDGDIILVDPVIQLDPAAIRAMRERLSGQIGVWQPSTVAGTTREDAAGSLIDALPHGLAPTGVLYVPAASRSGIADIEALEVALLGGGLALRPYPETVGTRTGALRRTVLSPDRVARYGAAPQRHLRQGIATLAAIGCVASPAATRRALLMRLLRSPIGPLVPGLVAYLKLLGKRI